MKFKKLTEQQKKKTIQEMIALLKTGKSNKHIRNLFFDSFKGKVSMNQVTLLVSEAGTNIETEHMNEVQDIKSLHIGRYDKNINDLLSVVELNANDIVPDDSEIAVDENGQLGAKKGITYEEWKSSRERKIKAYHKAIDTIIQKENILHILNDSLSIDISDEVDINITKIKVQSNFDVTKLTIEEQVELLELIKKCKVGSKEISGVINVKTGIEIAENVRVEKEIMHPNIEKIRHVSPSVESLPENSILLDPVANLKKNLARLAAKKFKDAGANLDEGEQKLLD